MQVIRALAPPGLQLGNDVYIEDPDCFTLVGPGAGITIGDETIFWGKSSVSAYIKGRISVGRRCYVASNARIGCRDRIEIGHHVLLSWDLTIFDYEHHPVENKLRQKQLDFMTPEFNPFCQEKRGLTKEDIDFFTTYWDNDAIFEHAPVRIGNNCWIGYGVSIMKGVTIGDNTIVAAKSVVVKSLPPDCIAAGNPAKVVREIQKPFEPAGHHPAKNSPG